jgi:hypothetical protein
VRDEGRPLAAGLQEQAANHRKRRWLRAIRHERYGKGTLMYQVWIKKTNTSEPPLKCRKHIRRRQNRGGDVAPGGVWRKPAYWPDGARHTGGVSLIQALMSNCGNLSQRCLRERHKQRPCEADSIDALHRGGQARSSDEVAVMAVERRGLATRRGFIRQLSSRRSG